MCIRDRVRARRRSPQNTAIRVRPQRFHFELKQTPRARSRIYSRLRAIVDGFETLGDIMKGHPHARELGSRHSSNPLFLPWPSRSGLGIGKKPGAAKLMRLATPDEFRPVAVNLEMPGHEIRARE